MGKKFFNVLLVATVLLGLNSNAFGFAFPDSYELSRRSLSMGGAMTGLADEFSAAYYNPAGLAQVRGSAFNLDYLYAAPDFEVNYLDGSGPLRIYDARGQKRVDPADSSDEDGLAQSFPTIGMMVDINQVASSIADIPVNLQMGAAISLPEDFSNLICLPARSPDIPHMLRMGDKVNVIFVALGLGVEVVEDFLYLGGGGTINLSVPGEAFIDNLSPDPGNTPDTAQLYQMVQAELAIRTKFSGTLGVMVHPFGNDFLRVGASWRDECKVRIALDAVAHINIGSVPQIDLGLYAQALTSYVPKSLNLGVAVDLGEYLDWLPLTISLDANKVFWSKFPLAFPDYVHYTADQGYTPNFDDVVNYAVGLEYKPTHNLTLNAGYSFDPTPVPNQSYQLSNYIDMDKRKYSLGLTYNIAELHKRIDILNSVFESLPIEVGAAVQYQDCEDYNVYKEGVVYRDGTPAQFIANSSNLYPQKSYKVEGDAMVYCLNMKVNF